MGPRTDAVVLPRVNLSSEQLKKLGGQLINFFGRLHLDSLEFVYDRSSLDALFSGERPLPWPHRDATDPTQLSDDSWAAIDLHGGWENLQPGVPDSFEFEEPFVPDRFREVSQFLGQSPILEAIALGGGGSGWRLTAHIERSALGTPIAFSVVSDGRGPAINQVARHLRASVSVALVEDILLDGQSWRRWRQKTFHAPDHPPRHP